MIAGDTNILDGKVAVVTGARGQIGWAVCETLAGHGANIVALSRHQLDLELTLKSLPGTHHSLYADITDTQSIKRANQWLTDCKGRCDILVNCAGWLDPISPSDLHALTDEKFDQCLAVNLRGVYATIREFSSLIQNTNGSLIVNISSQSGQRASNSCVAYAASKAGLDLMTRTLAKSMAPVRVVGIAPGYLEHATNGVTRLMSNDTLIQSSPLKCLATGQDIADMCVAFYTHLRHCTGITILADGGRLL